MTVTLPLETGIIYGPLFSRRLGLSLGVNLLPVVRKVCSFDCIYCHYGLTDRKAVVRDDDFPTPDMVYQAVEKALRSSKRFNTLTFSGNGEPTLHPHFTSIVKRIKSMRDYLRPGVTLSLYSNASTAGRPQIREVLEQFDNPILKLDTGDQQTFEKINRPLGDIKLSDIIASLKDVPNLVIQSLVVNGQVNSSTPEVIKTWQAVLAGIRPAKVQLYSCDYPVPIDGVERVLPYVLKRIARETEINTGIRIEPYWIS